MKEYKAKLDGSRAGLIWTLVEPLAFVLILSSLWFSLGKEEIAGVPIFLFMAAGMLPLKFVQSSLNAIALGVRQNLNLLDYPNVKPIDAIYARFLLETLMVVISGALMFGILYWVADMTAEVKDYPTFFVTIFLAACTALGMALIMGVYRTKSESVHRAVPIVSAPLLFVSAVFYPLSILPLDLQYWLSWNPIVQINELIRVSVFGMTQQRDVDIGYLAMYAVSALFFGYITYFANRFVLLKR